MKARLLLVVICGVIQACNLSWGVAPVAAASLFVNNSGSPPCSDGTAKAGNSAASPWCSIHRAATGATFGSGANQSEAVAAGDTVFITCGTYEAEAKDAVFHVALNPVNEGAPGAPIRFQAASGTSDCIRIKPRPGTGAGGSVIGSVNRDHIQWSGFDLREADWPWVPSTGYQNGLVLFHGDPMMVGGLLENSTLTGSAAPDRSGDNYTGLRIHGASAAIRNNTITTFGTSGHNNSCSTWYFGQSMVVEHNRFIGCGSGLMIKNNSGLNAGETQHIIRYNWIEPNSVGIFLFENTNGTALRPVLVYQNIIKGGDRSCIQAVWIKTKQDAKHAKVLNNTCVGQAEDCFRIVGPPVAGASFEFSNNICSGQPSMVLGTGGATAEDLVTSKVLWRHNVYFGFRTFANWAGIGSFDLNRWQSGYGQDRTAPAGVDSDPRFVNARAADFHLAKQSPALTHGRAQFGIGGADGTVIAAGAYITGAEVIGRRPQ